jgi:hypothetical protein
MYVETVPHRDSRPTILLRESHRQGRKVVKRTLANLSDWDPARLDALRRVLRGQALVPAEQRFAIQRSWPHGHVQAVLRIIHRLGLDTLITAQRGRERDLVLAMLVQRLLRPGSQLANTRRWRDTTLGRELGVENADVEELYDALDWLRERQPRIEAKLAARHLADGGQALYDLSTSFYTGATCPLAQFGHERDGKKGLPIIAYGVLTDAQGCPVAVQVYPGNTADPNTVADQADKLRDRFGLARVVLVGDRGMLTHARLEALRETPGIGWISALRSAAIRGLIEPGHRPRSLFDRVNLAEIRSPEFPGERLIACYNPLLADERRRTRDELLAATAALLEKLATQVARRTRRLLTAEQIGEQVGRVIHRYKVAKHFGWSLEERRLNWSRNETSIVAEAALDGIYVIRTSEAAAQLPASQAVRSYQNLAQVERAFRGLKGLDLRIRPIFQRTPEHVRAHIFLCLLAYYIEWHLRRVWAELLFEDEKLEAARATRDPVAPARPATAVRRKKANRITTTGVPVQSWDTLLSHLATRARHRCAVPDAPPGSTFELLTQPTPLQARALELVEAYPVPTPPHAK